MEQSLLFQSDPQELSKEATFTISSESTPLAYQLAPQTLDDYIGQTHLVGEGKPLRKLLESDRIMSMILWGPPGCGKTSLAKLISNLTKSYFVSMNAVTAKIADIKSSAEEAKSRKKLGQDTILFIDEIHRFSKTQQDALLPHVESGLFTLIGATTENPFFSVIPPLISRSRIFELEVLNKEQLELLLNRGITALSAQRKLTIDASAKAYLISQSRGDARTLFNLLEWCWNATDLASPIITQSSLEDLTQTKGVPLSIDSHYDMISALIKSMRGSDPEAAVYWLARLLKGGEDPEFIARRLIIFASEDIGLADVHALPLTTSLLQAVRFIGMPEIQINLSHVVTYLAKAAKSNVTYVAIKRANHIIEDGHIQAVPNHLRDAHYKGAKELGFGKGYKYPHDYEKAMVDQDYLSEALPVSLFDKQ